MLEQIRYDLRHLAELSRSWRALEREARAKSETAKAISRYNYRKCEIRGRARVALAAYCLLRGRPFETQERNEGRQFFDNSYFKVASFAVAINQYVFRSTGVYVRPSLIETWIRDRTSTLVWYIGGSRHHLLTQCGLRKA
jgi:hypothetical protein